MVDQATLTTRKVPLDSLHLDPSNARHHPNENLDAIVASLRRFGQAEPLVVQKSTGRIIGGNGRWVAMKKLGWTEAEVVKLDVDDLTATALGIALNRTAELATWDEETLGRLLSELRAEDALDGVGYSGEDIDALLEELREDTEGADIDDPGPVDPPRDPVSRPGDLWHLDNHRLLCGDSTSLDDVLRVMDGKRARLVATDPPYLINYSGERPNNSGKDWTSTYREIDIQDADAFFRGAFSNILQVVGDKVALYCWHAHKRQALISRIWEELEILDHQQIIWVKPTPVFGRVYWHFRHEPCMMGWPKGRKPDHDGSHEFNSVWEVDWNGKARVVGNEHPTQKPVELFARPMRKHTKPGDVCFEPFSGSGSQLIAAETLRRRCSAIEVSPPFVDVAVLRWQAATGKEATLDGSEKTFGQVKIDRIGAKEGEPCSSG